MRSYLLAFVFAIGCSLHGSGKDHCESQADCLNGYVCGPDNTCSALPDAAQGDGSGDGSAGACAPSGTFASERPPGPGVGHYYSTFSTLHVSGGTAQMLTSGDSAGSGIYLWSRGQPTNWTQSSIGAGVGGFTGALDGQLAATADGTLCVAYLGTSAALHVACEGAQDRSVAPRVDSSISIVKIGGTAGLAYLGQDNSLDGLLWQQFDGGAFDGNPGPAELVDGAYSSIGTTSIAVDSGGEPHVAYEVFPGSGPNTRIIYHAYRHGGSWTRELVDQETAYPGSIFYAAALSMVIDGDQPVIAYGHHSSRTLRLARRLATGTFDVHTLVAADPGYPNDTVGLAVQLQRDCAGQLLLVYQRNLSTDAANIGLTYARLTDAGLVDQQFLPPLPGTLPDTYGTLWGSLRFYIDSTGGQYVSTSLGSAGGDRILYFAAR
jgi:hypothetical protein